MTFRWQPLIDSGCRTGTELVRAWQVLQTKVFESVIATLVEGLGYGSTKKDIMKKQEIVRAKVLT